MILSETKKFAEDMAASAGPDRRVFALVGDLGAGKTAFAGFFLRALGVTDLVTSPTFVIMKNYPLVHSHFTRAYHIDCYRLKNPEEILLLGFAEILKDEKNIVLIEWADRIAGILPPETAWIDFTHVAEDSRAITVRPKQQ